MILDFYFVVGSHFRFPGLVFCSEFGATLLDGFVFCRPLFSTKSPVSTLTPNEQGDEKDKEGEREKRERERRERERREERGEREREREKM